MTGYQPQTTFWDDFNIAEAYGSAAIRDTYNRIMNGWSDNYIYLTELVIVLNWNIWYWDGCQSSQAKEFEDNIWVEARGIIRTGDYHGKIPIIEIKTIKKITTPEEIYVYPPKIVKNQDGEKS